MTYLGVIIGFTYHQDPSTQTLSSIIEDVGRMVGLIRKGGGIPIIITDTPNDSVKFLDTHTFIVTTSEEFFNAIKELELNNEQRVIIYYSGHGETESRMRLPDAVLYPLADFRDLITSMAPHSAEIIFIIDCCYGGGLSLPYTLDFDKRCFKLSGDLDRPCLQSVICISAANERQRSSVVESVGSIFTKHIAHTISERIINLLSINSLVKAQISYEGMIHKQTLNIHASYPIQPILFTWVINHTLGIYINEGTSTLILEKLR